MSEAKIDWKQEQDRFMALAYQRCERAARRAFRRWHSRKRDDAIAECVGKAWATWVNNLTKGKDPLALLGPNIHFAVLWVRFDRMIAGRARSYDVYDYRAGMTRHLMDQRGQLTPHERSDRINGFLEWVVRADADDPAELAAALEAAGLTLDQYLAA